MIDERRSKNASWTAGSIVKIGFTKMRVLGSEAVKDGMPDLYFVTSLDGQKVYRFVPYNGIERIELSDLPVHCYNNLITD